MATQAELEAARKAASGIVGAIQTRAANNLRLSRAALGIKVPGDPVLPNDPNLRPPVDVRPGALTPPRRGAGGTFGNTPPAAMPAVSENIKNLFGGQFPASPDKAVNDALAADSSILASQIVGGLQKNVTGKSKMGELDDKTHETVRAQVMSALRDNTWTPADRQMISLTYQRIANKLQRGDTDFKDLNNFSIRSEYRRLLNEWEIKTTGDRARENFGSGGFFDTYKGPITGNAADAFGPGFLINEDENGFLYIADTNEVLRSVSATMRTDPAAAAAMMTRLSAWGAYPGAQIQYVAQRLQFDKAGNPVGGTWAKEDQEALTEFLQNAALSQAGGDLRAWNDMIDDVSVQNQKIATGEGYGRGGGGGGGGGGAGGGVSYTPADLLKQTINGIARARLGQVLNDSEIAAFVADFHQKEAAFVNARIAGADGMQVDPESAAAAWIESRYRDQMAAQQGNSYIMDLARFLLGGGIS